MPLVRRDVGIIPRARWLLTFLIAAFVTTASHAHDPYETFMSVTVRAEQLDLAVTMAQVNALRLIDPSGKIAGLTVENFAAHRPQLVRAAATFFALASRGQPLAVRRVEVTLTEENDVAFTITYPRPAPGPLHFSAAFLKKLGEGYGGILDASDTAGHHLGWEQLSWDLPDYEVVVPAPEASPKKN